VFKKILKNLFFLNYYFNLLFKKQFRGQLIHHYLLRGLKLWVIQFIQQVLKDSYYNQIFLLDFIYFLGHLIKVVFFFGIHDYYFVQKYYYY
jgi:hypothetical protein